jgi:hypothetical protein
MAFSLGTWNPQPWTGKIPRKLVQTSAVLGLANAGGNFSVMKSGTETRPVDAEFTVRAYGKLETIDLQSPEMGEVTLRARKIEGAAVIAEEDLVEGKAYSVDIVRNLRDRGTSNTAAYFDNASLGTSGDATTGETNILRPYRSLYTAVRVDAPAGNYTTIAAAGTVAEYRAAIKGMIETAERTEYAEDIVVIMSDYWQSYLRDMPVDGSNGRPIWDQEGGTILGKPIYWTKGARLASTSGAGTATHNPVGNHLAFAGPRNHLMVGRAPFSTGNAAVPEAYLSDPTTGVGMLNDSAWFKLRSRLAMSVAEADAWTALERLA